MRASKRLARLAVCAAALSAAGCGASSSPPTAPHVNLSISAPTDGATVGVHTVTILGTVSPAGAQVAVNGRPAKVSGSTFTGTLYVSTSDQKIVVSGAAHGYVGSQASTTVTYSASVAHQIVASARVNTPAPTPVAAQFPAAVLTQAFGLPAAALAHVRPAAAVTAPHGGSASGGGSVSGGAHSTTSGAGSKSGSSSSSSTGGGSNTSAPASTPSAPAPPTPAQIAAAIRDSWVHGCVAVGNGGNVVPYCTCTYTHLAGQLQTRAAADALMKEMAPYLHTGDFSKLPRFIQRAVEACISKLPPVAPSSGPPVVSQLPGVQHGATTTPAQTTSTDSTPTPPPPAPVAPTSTSTTSTSTSTTSASTSSRSSTSPLVTPAVVTASAHSTMVSALKDLNSAISAKPPTPLPPADPGAVGQTHARAAKSRLTPQGGHQGLRDIRVIGHALGYALHWVGDHDRSGSDPYGNRVQRRLYNRLSAALKLAS